MSNLRQIEALILPDVVRSAPKLAQRPEFVWIDPRGLLVDDSYQRNLSDRSMTLIRKIVAGWDWCAFKAPIVVRVAGGYHVIDGQHTAIAAASNPAIETIPVMVVQAEDTRDRAVAFVKHNRDRLAVTPTQIHFAMVAAGDPEALTMNQVCERAGARILKNPPYNGRWAVGDTMAISCLSSIIGRRHAAGARRVVQICVKGDLAPVSNNFMRAVEELLFGESYKGQMEDAAISDTIFRMGAQAEKDAMKFAAEHDLPIWRALVVILFKNTKKVRRGRQTLAA